MYWVSMGVGITFQNRFNELNYLNHTAWLSSGYSDLQVRLIGESKLSKGVNVC